MSEIIEHEEGVVGRRKPNAALASCLLRLSEYLLTAILIEPNRKRHVTCDAYRLLVPNFLPSLVVSASHSGHAFSCGIHTTKLTPYGVPLKHRYLSLQDSDQERIGVSDCWKTLAIVVRWKESR